MWAANTGFHGWSVTHFGEDAQWDFSFSPDQFGCVRSWSYRLGGDQINKTLDLYEVMQTVRGRLHPIKRFGDRWSSVRERLCVEIAQYLNEVYG